MKIRADALTEQAVEWPLHVRLMLGVRRRYEWTQAQLGSVLMVSERTVRRWENQEGQEPSVFVVSALRELLG